MKFFLLISILSGTIIAQHTLPNFTFKPKQVWQQLSYDSAQVKFVLSSDNKDIYSIEFNNRGDSCTKAYFTFLNDTLYEASYFFEFHGDIQKTFELVEKKNKSYVYAHGNFHQSLTFPKGYYWFNFTPEQVRSFVREGYLYNCDWTPKKDYTFKTVSWYDHYERLLEYKVTFMSPKAYYDGSGGVLVN